MQQHQATLDAAEAQRNSLIGAIGLRTVSESPGTVRWLH
jgi:hypothetical protein